MNLLFIQTAVLHRNLHHVVEQQIEVVWCRRVHIGKVLITLILDHDLGIVCFTGLKFVCFKLVCFKA